MHLLIIWLVQTFLLEHGTDNEGMGSHYECIYCCHTISQVVSISAKFASHSMKSSQLQGATPLDPPLWAVDLDRIGGKAHRPAYRLVLMLAVIRPFVT